MANILVTGGTGTIGSHLVQFLKDDGADFQVMVRDEEKAASLQEDGTQTVLADFEHPASLDSAVKGVEKVFLLSPPAPNQVELQGNMVKACEKAGVKQIVKVSAIGSAKDSPVSLGRWHAETEEHIKNTGMDYTFLHPHSFMQNHLFMSAPTVKSDGALYSPLGDAKIPIIDARNIAAVAATTLTEDGHSGQTYGLTGPTAISMADIAETLSKLLDKDVQHIPVNMEQARQGMLDAGLPEWLADDLTELNKIYAAGHASEVSPDVEKVTGRKATTFEQFARDHIQAFQ